MSQPTTERRLKSNGGEYFMQKTRICPAQLRCDGATIKSDRATCRACERESRRREESRKK